MATVPDNTGQTVAPRGEQASIQRQSSPEAFGAGVGEGLKEVAGATDQAATMLFQHAQVQQGLANAADADDAATTFAQKADTIGLDYQTTQLGKNAKPQYQDYQQQIEEARLETGKTLTNPMAQKLYDNNSRKTVFNITSQMARHAATQQNKYETDTSNAVISNAGDALVNSFDDPEIVNQSLDTIQHQVTIQNIRLGADDTTAAANVQAAQGKYLSDAIETKSVDDPISAQKQFDEYRGLMTGKQVSNMTKYLHQVSQPWIGRDIGDKATFGGLGEEKVDLSHIKADPTGFFSGIAGGPVTITSPERTPAHNAAVGGVPNSLHIPANGTAFDIAPAPGQTLDQLKAAIKAADLKPDELLVEKKGDPNSTGPHVHVAWKNGNGPVAARRTYNNLEELDEGLRPAQLQADAYIDKYHNGNPQLKALAENVIDANFSRMRTGFVAQAEASTGRMTDALLPTDDSASPTSTAELFHAYPGAQNDYLALTPSQKSGVNRQLKHNANPTLADMTPEQMSNAAELNGLRISSRADFAKLDPLTDPRFDGLPKGTKLELMKAQAAIKAGQPSNSAEQFALKAAEPILQAKAANGDFPTNDKGYADKASSDYTQFIGALSANVKAYHDTYKKDPDLQHIRDMTTSLLIDQHYKAGNKATLVPGVPNDWAVRAQASAKSQGVVLDDKAMQHLYANRKVK